jgi:type II secretory pathway pseudopilin PulG
MSPNPVARQRSARGFTIVEMTISLFILVVVIVGVLALFDLASRISRVQVDVAGMQESVRTGQYDMIRMVRMAGRGGVPIQTDVLTPPFPALTSKYLLPSGNAISVVNNVKANVFMDAPPTNTTSNTHRILEGTDVLTVRGAFNSPAYGVADGSFTFAGNAGQFRLDYYPRPALPVPQTLQPLANAILDSRKPTGRPEAMILVSNLDQRFYHIVEIDAANSVITSGDPDGAGPLPTQTVSILVRFTVTPSGPPPAAASPRSEYWWMSGSDWDTQITQSGVATAALLEEYRYYILDDDREAPGTTAAPTHPRLVRARVYPGSQLVYNSDPANWTVPIADNVADLQVAFGIETGTGSAFVPEEGLLTADKATDEWLFNVAGDSDAAGNVITPGKWTAATSHLAYVRLTTTAYSERRDRNLPAEPITNPVAINSDVSVTTEDHGYTIWNPKDPPRRPAKLLTPDQSYRRRALRTVIDLRNLS